MSDVPMDLPVIECRGLSKSFREGADAFKARHDVQLYLTNANLPQNPGW